MKLILYSGPNCCLCDQAEQIINQLPDRAIIELTKKNVREDTKLYHLYGARIPVVERLDNQTIIEWPFDLAQLEEFIS